MVATKSCPPFKETRTGTECNAAANADADAGELQCATPLLIRPSTTTLESESPNLHFMSIRKFSSSTSPLTRPSSPPIIISVPPVFGPKAGKIVTPPPVEAANELYM